MTAYRSYSSSSVSFLSITPRYLLVSIYCSCGSYGPLTLLVGAPANMRLSSSSSYFEGKTPSSSSGFLINVRVLYKNSEPYPRSGLGPTLSSLFSLSFSSSSLTFWYWSELILELSCSSFSDVLLSGYLRLCPPAVCFLSVKSLSEPSSSEDDCYRCFFLLLCDEEDEYYED